jgi:hypothetical protein
MAAIVAALIGLPAACAGPANGTRPPPANPARTRIEVGIKTVNAGGDLAVRYNPAACDCPPFELRLASGWIRASWSNIDAPQNRALSAQLKTTRPEQWPVNLVLKGRVDSEVMRTSQGQYAVQLTSTAVVGELAKPRPVAAPQPKPTPPPPPPGGGPPHEPPG